MAEMFAADQEARRSFSPDMDWAAVSKADAARRARTRELLDDGSLKTGPDFYTAAFIFQHGGSPEDYLLAHALAVRALGLGVKEAEWIAAASLDRYLQSVERPQIYGTQFQSAGDEVWTQGNYDKDLLTDQIRQAAGVESLDAQAAKLERMNRPSDSKE